MKSYQRWIAMVALGAFLNVSLPLAVWADKVGNAALEFAGALPSKYSGMAAGWFFFNVYMTEWYSWRADRLSMESSTILFKVAADKEAADTLSQFDTKVDKEKKRSKQQDQMNKRNEYMDKNFDKVDTTKKLDDNQKKDLAVAMLKTATAILMTERAINGAKKVLTSADDATAEVTSGLNPIKKAKAAAGVTGATKSVKNTAEHTKDTLPRMKKISELLNALAKTNNVKPPSEKEVSTAESSYQTEVTFED